MMTLPISLASTASTRTRPTMAMQLVTSALLIFTETMRDMARPRTHSMDSLLLSPVQMPTTVVSSKSVTSSSSELASMNPDMRLRSVMSSKLALSRNTRAKLRSTMTLNTHQRPNMVLNLKLVASTSLPSVISNSVATSSSAQSSVTLRHPRHL